MRSPSSGCSNEKTHCTDGKGSSSQQYGRILSVTQGNILDEPWRIQISTLLKSQFPCEADCSSGVAAIVKGAGYKLKNEKLKNVSTACYTGNLRAALKAAGFKVLTDKKYLTSDAYLLEGDILLNDGAHVATNLTNGAKASGGGASQTVPINSNVKLETAKGFNKSLAGTYKVTGAGALNLRSGAGTGKDKKVLTTMQSGETCQCYGYYTDVSGVKWLYVAYKNVVGFASSNISKVAEEGENMLYYLGKGTEFKKEDCKEYKTIEGALKAAAKNEELVVMG